MFFSDFKYANTHIRNEVFQKYCTSFYGSQILPLYSNEMESIYCAWRKAIRKVWRVPYSTHCNILPYLANCMEIELLLAKRCIKFIDTMCKNDNKVVRTITQMGLLGSYSVIGANKRYLLCKFQFDICNVNACWAAKFNEELQRTSLQVKELCTMRDSCGNNFLSNEECTMLITHLCTS